MPLSAATRRMPLNFKLPSVLLVALCSLTLIACNSETKGPQETASATTYFPIELGGHTLQLQLALNDAERRKGLMFRDELPPDHGMLFVFERPSKQGFWMKGTKIPLDIGYLDASGELLEIHKLFPYDETGVASHSEAILIAIETNRDWYKKNDVTPGAELDMESLRSAITARGFNPANYAIED